MGSMGCKLSHIFELASTDRGLTTKFYMFKFIISTLLVILLFSCKTKTVYVKAKGIMGEYIYSDSLITIYRNVECHGEKLSVLYGITRKRQSAIEELSITNISNSITGIDNTPVLIYKDPCLNNSNRVKTFKEIPKGLKSLQTCGSYVILYLYGQQKIKKKDPLIITTDLVFKYGLITINSKLTDTLHAEEYDDSFL